MKNEKLLKYQEIDGQLKKLVTEINQTPETELHSATAVENNVYDETQIQVLEGPDACVQPPGLPEPEFPRRRIHVQQRYCSFL